MQENQNNPVYLINHDLIPKMLTAFNEATKKAYKMLWDIFMSQMNGHWLQLFSILFVVFIVLLLWALLTRHWGSLGSFLYNFFYFGTLLLIGWTVGPEFFANDYFKLFLAVLYVVCFLIVRVIIKNLGFRI
jgi:hypothetical protein